jgi:hypothetical protein
MGTSEQVRDYEGTRRLEDGDVNATQHQVPESQGFERDEVFAWRRAQLLRSGFPESLAARVADDSRFDLHQLIELVDNGCAPELAFRILAPLEEDEAAFPSLWT